MVKVLARLGFWPYIALFTVAAIIISEFLIVIQSYWLTGGFFDKNLLIVGFITPAVDAFVVFFISAFLIRYLVQTQNNLESVKNELTQSNKALKEAYAQISLEKVNSELYFNMAGSMLVVLNPDGTIAHLNQRALDILEVKADDAIGKNWFFLCLPPDEAKEVHKFFEIMLCGETDEIEYHENSIVTSSGKKRLIAWHNSYFKDEKGKIFQTLSSGEDITEIRAYKNELEQKVEQEIQKRNAQEKILIQQSKLASMGEMVGAIAHQWRQPLTALGMFVQDVEEAYVHEELDKNYIDKFVRESMDQILSMSNTIDDFMNFLKPGSEYEDFDVKENINNVLKLFENNLKKHGIDVRIHMAKSPVIIYGLHSQFSHVVQNIISNSIDAIAEHKNTIHQPCIIISIEKTEDKTTIVILDNGKGMNKADIERIFEPYFTTKEKGIGTGIGMYMSKMIIENNFNGIIDVSNAENGLQTIITLVERGNY